jgi:hypothetical protein
MHRCQSDFAAKEPVEETRILIARLVGNGLDGGIGRLEHLLCLLEPEGVHIIEGF